MISEKKPTALVQKIDLDDWGKYRLCLKNENVDNFIKKFRRDFAASEAKRKRPLKKKGSRRKRLKEMLLP